MARRPLTVGSRGSALALAQTTIVCDAIRALNPSVDIRIERIVTTGDARPDASLAALGRGVFVTQIEQALREHRIDFAVHSAKDLPSTLAPELVIAAYLERLDARDVLVSRQGTLRELPPGARVGTSSPRRICQLRALRPDLEVLEMRGNVDTRLRKLEAGEFDAILLAAAGLLRLGLENVVTEWLDPHTVIPCVGQGALAVETRADDTALRELVAPLDDEKTRVAVTAERAFLAELGAGCLSPAAAHARLDVDGTRRLRIRAMIGAADGRFVSVTRDAAPSESVLLGREAAHEALRSGGRSLLANPMPPTAGLHVAITRPEDQARGLAAMLRARGATPHVCPTVAIQFECSPELDAALSAVSTVAWIAFTSANAVRAVSAGLRRIGRTIPAGVRLAAVGSATATAVEAMLRRADFVASGGGADALAVELPDVVGRRVLFPCGDLASDALEDGLARRGAAVHRVVAYRTVRGDGVESLRRLVATEALDVVIFASPSAVKNAASALEGGAAQRPVVACIGASTAAAARADGFPPEVVADEQSDAGIVAALERWAAASEGTRVRC